MRRAEQYRVICRGKVVVRVSNAIRVAILLALILAVVGSVMIVRTCLSSDPRGAVPSLKELAQPAASQTAPATAPAPPLTSESDLVGPKTDPTQPLGDMQPLQSSGLPPHTESAPEMTQNSGTWQMPSTASAPSATPSPWAPSGSSPASSLPAVPSSATAPRFPASQAFAPSPVPPPMGVAPADSAAQSGGDDIVYVTPDGTHYHRAGCPHLKHGAIPMKRREAQARYQPCPVCNP